MTSPCEYRKERPKRIVAELLVLLEYERMLNVSYEGIMDHVQRTKVLDHFMPKIKNIPWDTFVV